MQITCNNENNQSLCNRNLSTSAQRQTVTTALTRCPDICWRGIPSDMPAHGVNHHDDAACPRYKLARPHLPSSARETQTSQKPAVQRSGWTRSHHAVEVQPPSRSCTQPQSTTSMAGWSLSAQPLQQSSSRWSNPSPLASLPH